MDTPAVMQRDNERTRIAVDSRLVNGGEQCTFLAIHERTGNCWVFYPHGVGKLGTRMPEANAVTLARAILAAVDNS